MSKKLLYTLTIGCAMNERDSEHIIAELSDEYEPTDDAKKADLIILNTCSVREKPVAKMFSEIGHFKKIKKPSAKIGVCGCTASQMGDEIIKRAPVVSFVLGARNISKVKEAADKERYAHVDMDYDDSLYVFGEYRKSKVKALINIMVGCDKECTFCIVPFTRGEEISIPQELILKEAVRAAESGAKELHLLGQNVNNYGKRFSGAPSKSNFTQLLREISKIEGIERIRFSSPHPLHADDEFIEEFASNPKICKQIHFPLQSGSDKILRSMKRGYTQEWFLKKVEKMRSLCPDMTIGTDIIVGFPGESDEDFAETMKVLNEAKFEAMFSFKYSPRPGTPAAAIMDAVDDEVASERLYALQNAQNSFAEAALKAQVNKEQFVLFENNEDGVLYGKTDNGFVVKVEADEPLVGEIRKVVIVGAKRHGLDGKLI